MKRLLSFLLFACVAQALLPVSSAAQTTTFIAHLKDLAQAVPASPQSPPAFIELTLRNCAGAGTNPTIVHVNSGATVVFPVNLYPDGTGLINHAVYDQNDFVCGSSSGVAYYHVRLYQGDSTRSVLKKLLFEDDYNIQGATFTLDSASTRSGAVISPPPATAVLTNPAGNQTVIQPAATTLSINNLTASFAQPSNGTDMIPGQRFTDTSPTGNFLDFKNAAGSTPLWEVDVTGTLLAGIIPNARLSTPPATGTGTTNKITKFTNGPGGAIGDSGLTDNGTTISTSEALSAANITTTSGTNVFGGPINAGSNSITGGAVAATSLNGIRYASATINQSDINAACATQGKFVIPPGNYTISAGLTVPDKCYFGGSGQDNTILTTSGTVAFDVISNADQTTGNGISVHDLTINSASFSSGTGRAAYFKNIVGLHFEHVKMLNSWSHGLMVDVGSSQVWIKDNWCDGVSVGSCFAIANTPTNGVSTDLTITGNYAANSTTANGIFVLGSSGAGVTGSGRVTICNNRAFHNKDTGIEVGDSSTVATVCGNIVNISGSGTTGILLRSSQNVSAVGNVVVADTNGNLQTGIYAWNNSGDNVPFKNITITGNTVQGLNGTNSSGIAWSSNSASSDSLTIVGNTSINNTTNFDPRTTNVTNIARYSNSDGINDVSKPVQFQKTGNPAVWYRDPGQSITAGGLWRTGLSGTSFDVDMNQAAGGDFSSFFTAIQIDNAGDVIFAQNKAVFAGSAGFDVRNGLTSRWCSDNCATIKSVMDASVGKFTTWTGNSTAGEGLTSVRAFTSQRSESAADTNVVTLTPPAVAGSYRISFVLSVSAANAATLGWTATWKDSNGAAQTPTNLSLFQSGTAAPALTFTTSVAGNYYGEARIDTDGSATAIVIKLTFTGTSFTAKASAGIERLN